MSRTSDEVRSQLRHQPFAVTRRASMTAEDLRMYHRHVPK